MESASELVPFPLLLTPIESNYRACTIPYRFPSDNPRKPTPIELSWIDVFYNSIPSFKYIWFLYFFNFASVSVSFNCVFDQSVLVCDVDLSDLLNLCFCLIGCSCLFECLADREILVWLIVEIGFLSVKKNLLDLTHRSFFLFNLCNRQYTAIFVIFSLIFTFSMKIFCPFLVPSRCFPVFFVFISVKFRKILMAIWDFGGTSPILLILVWHF